MSRLDPNMISKPMFIHLDMSLSGDKTGIAGVWIKGKKQGLQNNSKELYYQVAFSGGNDICFEKLSAFCY